MMPLFDYYCKQCLLEFEVLVEQRLAEAEIECPACAEKLEKLLCSPSIRVH